MQNKKQLFEALKTSEIRPYMGLDRQLANERIKNVWDNLKKLAKYKNRSGNRLYFALDEVKDNSENKYTMDCESFVTKYLQKYGYEVVNFYEGKVRKIGGKNIINIGKILTFLGKSHGHALELLKKYTDEKSLLTIGGNYLIVISKHPYDIVGMSTDRNWTSCMNIRNDQTTKIEKYLQSDVTQGTIVSYLITENDLNIKKPIARILIKPYYSITNRSDILYGVEYDSYTKYGLHNKNYPKTLLRIFDFCQNKKTGIFVEDNELYGSGTAKPIVKGQYYRNKIDKISRQTRKLEPNLTPEKLFHIAPWLAEASFSDAHFGVQSKSGSNDPYDLILLFLGGEWYNGDWINGMWENGTWHNGTWHNGIFTDGRWKNGRWLNGTFFGGVWYEGIWENGLFEHSAWYNGDWFNGTFKNSKWRDGNWHQGEWIEGAIFDHETQTWVRTSKPPR